MRHTGFRGIADVLGQVREVDYDGRALTLSGLTLEEAHAIIAAVETLNRSHYGAAAAVSSTQGVVAPGYLAKPEGGVAVPAPAAPEKGEAAAPTPSAPVVAPEKPAEEAAATGRGKRGAKAAVANGVTHVNGAAPDAAPTAVSGAAVAAHVEAEFPTYATATDQEKNAWVKLAAKELVAYRESAPATLAMAWEHLLRTAPQGWFKKHLQPKPTRAEKAAEKVAETAEAHRALNADVLARAQADVASGQAAGAPTLSVDVTAEIRAAFGINPALLAPAMKQVLVDQGVEEGHLAPALAGDLETAWPALCEVVPPGWFREHADAAKAGKASAPVKPNDPAGLAPDGVDPDEDPVQGPTPALDVAKVQSLATLRDVLVYLAESGIATQKAMIETCTRLRDSVPTLQRVTDLGSRIPRALATVGLDLPPG